MNAASRWRRVPLLSRLLGGLYLPWSCLVYFGSLAGRSHEWWPLFLYFFIWPIGAVYERISLPAFFALWPHPTKTQFLLYDGISGAVYIVGGTLWLVMLGWIVTAAWSRLFTNGRSA